MAPSFQPSSSPLESFRPDTVPAAIRPPCRTRYPSRRRRTPLRPLGPVAGQGVLQGPPARRRRGPSFPSPASPTFDDPCASCSMPSSPTPAKPGPPQLRRTSRCRCTSRWSPPSRTSLSAWDPSASARIPSSSALELEHLHPPELAFPRWRGTAALKLDSSEVVDGGEWGSRASWGGGPVWAVGGRGRDLALVKGGRGCEPAILCWRAAAARGSGGCQGGGRCGRSMVAAVGLGERWTARAAGRRQRTCGGRRQGRTAASFSFFFLIRKCGSWTGEMGLTYRPTCQVHVSTRSAAT